MGKKINHRVTEAQSQAEPGGKRGPRIQESRDKIGRALEMHKWEEAVGCDAAFIAWDRILNRFSRISECAKPSFPASSRLNRCKWLISRV